MTTETQSEELLHAVKIKSGVRRRLISPINKRRWNNFKANRRGYYSLWIFIFLFVITLFSEFIANDRPILVWHQSQISMPVLFDYGEERYVPEAEKDDPLLLPQMVYTDGYFDELLGEGSFAIWPPIRFSYLTQISVLPQSAPTKPSWLYSREERCRGYFEGTDDLKCSVWYWNWLGTDGLGRDILARIVYGFRISVLFGLVLTFLSAIIGVSLGAIQGYFGGRTDLIMQRVIEVWSSMPVLYLLLIISAVLTPGFWVLLIIMLFFSWVAFVGIVRAEFLRARNFEYVAAARALGVSNRTIMARHLLPNAMVATLTFMPFILNGSITTLTSLDFLGLGLPPGSASLGDLLRQGRAHVEAPWIGLTGLVVISIMLSLLIFIGEAVRDAFDPRKTFV